MANPELAETSTMAFLGTFTPYCKTKTQLEKREHTDESGTILRRKDRS
jgi:hypothetical protein